MTLSRRNFSMTGAALVGASTLTLARPALANTAPIRVGWLAALTGPGSAPSIGMNRGVNFCASLINAAGGINGRKIEIVMRDTQGVPTAAVDAAQDMISNIKVDAIWGPTNSGESLAVTPIMARNGMPNLHPCAVDSLINPEKYPNAFRVSPSNTQWDDAVRHYCLAILKTKKVAVIGDTTGYGLTAAAACAKAFEKDGAQVVYKAMIDQTQPDVRPNLVHARNAGAEVIVVWSVSTGLDARLFNARAAMNWDVPFAGHPSLASGSIKALLDKPSNWDKVYAVGYKSCSFNSAGQLPPRTQQFIDKLQGKVELKDTLLWWVAVGFDAINLIGDAVKSTGSTKHAAFIEYWNSLHNYPGYFGDYSFSKTNHNGYPTDEVVMSVANVGKDGAFALAPGYS